MNDVSTTSTNIAIASRRASRWLPAAPRCAPPPLESRSEEATIIRRGYVGNKLSERFHGAFTHVNANRRDTRVAAAQPSLTRIQTPRLAICEHCCRG